MEKKPKPIAVTSTGRNKPTTGQNKAAALPLYEGMHIINKASIKTDDLFVDRDIEMNVGEYVPFRTPDFIDELTGLIYVSPTLSGAIEKLTDFTIGQGWQLLDQMQGLQSGVKSHIEYSDQEVAALSLWLDQPQNAAGETLYEVVKKVVFSYWAFGNAFCEICKTSTSVSIYAHETKDIRPVKSTDKIVTKFGYCKKWGAGETIVPIPRYPDLKEGAAIIHFSKYALGSYYWGLPKWISSKLWVELEYLIPKRNIAHFKNGMVPSGVLQIFGNMTKPEADKYVKTMTEKFTGVDNDFKILIQILRDPANKANFVPMSNPAEQDGAFMKLEDMCKEMICTPMGISTSLLSAKSAGEIGGNQQLRSEFEALYNTVVVKVQIDVLQKVVTPYLREAAAVTKDGALASALKKAQLSFVNVVPVSFMGDLNISDVLTQNEKREIAGYPPLEEITTQGVAGMDVSVANFLKNITKWQN